MRLLTPWTVKPLSISAFRTVPRNYPDSRSALFRRRSPLVGSICQTNRMESARGFRLNIGPTNRQRQPMEGCDRWDEIHHPGWPPDIRYTLEWMGALSLSRPAMPLGSREIQTPQRTT